MAKQRPRPRRVPTLSLHLPGVASSWAAPFDPCRALQRADARAIPACSPRRPARTSSQLEPPHREAGCHRRRSCPRSPTPSARLVPRHAPASGSPTAAWSERPPGPVPVLPGDAPGPGTIPPAGTAAGPGRCSPRPAAVRQKDPNLTVLDLPGRAAVLPLDSHRLGPFLQEAGLVDDADPIRLAKALHDKRLQLVTHGVGIPLRTKQQPLHRLRVFVAHRFCHLPAVLARNGRQQPTQILPSRFTRFAADKEVHETGSGMPQTRSRIGRFRLVSRASAPQVTEPIVASLANMHKSQLRL